MKALRAFADWVPRDNYRLTPEEISSGRATFGSMVWKDAAIRIVDEPAPSAAPDELVVRIRYCGICGSDTHVLESDADGYIIFSGPAKLPCTLGHEYAGEVVEVGGETTGFAKGDLVTGESILWCGKCMSCRYGMLNQCENVELLGLTADGAFAEYIAVKAKYCWSLNSLRERFSDDEVLRVGALIEPLGCAYNGIFISGGGFHPGAYAVVYGAGPIGLGAVSLLRATGAGLVVAVDPSARRLETAKRLGADYVFAPAPAEELAPKIREITGGWGADLQVEAAGAAKQTLPLMQELCAKRGKIVYLGRADALATVEFNRIVSGAHEIVGSRGHSGYGIFPNIIRLLRNGRLEGIEEIITSVLPFQRIHEAFSLSTARSDGKILVDLG